MDSINTARSSAKHINTVLVSGEKRYSNIAHTLFKTSDCNLRLVLIYQPPWCVPLNRKYPLPSSDNSGEDLETPPRALEIGMPAKDNKEGSHKKFFSSLRGKKNKDKRAIKKGLSEALGASLGAIRLQPEDDGQSLKL